LRGLQDRDALERLLGTLTQIRSRLGLSLPLLLKIAPDLDGHALDDIADVGMACGIEGLIISNTTLARPASLKSRFAQEAGGLSGAPLFEPSTNILHEMFARTEAKLVLVGVGGVASGAGAYAKIRAGASLVQLYTALAYRGPGLVAQIQRELVDCLSRDGFAQVGDAVGAAHRK
jgi:dihydroorotate dehydrogenase